MYGVKKMIGEIVSLDKVKPLQQVLGKICLILERNAEEKNIPRVDDSIGVTQNQLMTIIQEELILDDDQVKIALRQFGSLHYFSFVNNLYKPNIRAWEFYDFYKKQLKNNDLTIKSLKEGVAKS